MLTSQAKVRMIEDGTLEVRVPATALPPGEHQAVIVVGEVRPPERRSQPADFPVHEGGSWVDGLSLRREDLYGDDGR